MAVDEKSGRERASVFEGEYNPRIKDREFNPDGSIKSLILSEGSESTRKKTKKQAKLKSGPKVSEKETSAISVQEEHDGSVPEKKVKNPTLYVAKQTSEDSSDASEVKYVSARKENLISARRHFVKACKILRPTNLALVVGGGIVLYAALTFSASLPFAWAVGLGLGGIGAICLGSVLPALNAINAVVNLLPMNIGKNSKTGVTSRFWNKKVFKPVVYGVLGTAFTVAAAATYIKPLITNAPQLLRGEITYQQALRKDSDEVGAAYTYWANFEENKGEQNYLSYLRRINSMRPAYELFDPNVDGYSGHKYGDQLTSFALRDYVLPSEDYEFHSRKQMALIAAHVYGIDPRIFMVLCDREASNGDTYNVDTDALGCLQYLPQYWMSAIDLYKDGITNNLLNHKEFDSSKHREMVTLLKRLGSYAFIHIDEVDPTYKYLVASKKIDSAMRYLDDNGKIIYLPERDDDGKVVRDENGNIIFSDIPKKMTLGEFYTKKAERIRLSKIQQRNYKAGLEQGKKPGELRKPIEEDTHLYSDYTEIMGWRVDSTMMAMVKSEHVLDELGDVVLLNNTVDMSITQFNNLIGDDVYPNHFGGAYQHDYLKTRWLSSAKRDLVAVEDSSVVARMASYNKPVFYTNGEALTYHEVRMKFRSSIAAVSKKHYDSFNYEADRVPVEKLIMIPAGQDRDEFIARISSPDNFAPTTTGGVLASKASHYAPKSIFDMPEPLETIMLRWGDGVNIVAGDYSEKLEERRQAREAWEQSRGEKDTEGVETAAQEAVIDTVSANLDAYKQGLAAPSNVGLLEYLSNNGMPASAAKSFSANYLSNPNKANVDLGYYFQNRENIGKWGPKELAFAIQVLDWHRDNSDLTVNESKRVDNLVNSLDKLLEDPKVRDSIVSASYSPP